MAQQIGAIFYTLSELAVKRNRQTAFSDAINLIYFNTKILFKCDKNLNRK